jgi:colanic acid/amylovoran/stewartan biosynthesis glycosyltransferase WcaL/AmsK/CpsK
MKASVAHFVPLYLPRTETFIYQILTHHRRYRPVVLAHHRVETAPLFPLRHVYVEPELQAQRDKNAWLWRIPGLWRLRPPISFGGVLRRHEVGVLHVHFGHTGTEVLELSRRFHIPQVTSFYGWDDTVAYGDPRRAEMFQRLFAEGECFLVEGGHIAKRLAALGCAPEKILVHRIGIDLAAIPFRPPSATVAGEPARVLICGRMVEKKGHRLALSATARVRQRGIPIELRIIGDGPLRSAIEADIAALGLDGAARLLGSLTYDEYLAELGAAHVVLQPSLTAADGDTEGGAPTVLIEAQAAGKPIVTTRHADIPEIVVAGKSAVLVAEGDVEGVAEALRELLSAPGRWLEMGTTGRRHVESAHDIRRQVERLEALYDRLSAERRVP